MAATTILRTAPNRRKIPFMITRTAITVTPSGRLRPANRLIPVLVVLKKTFHKTAAF